MNDQGAKEIVDGLGYTHNESLYVRAVGRHETNYGDGWAAKGPGTGSNNWGAITTNSPDSLSFKHEDVRNDGNGVITYTTWFKGYLSPFDGARDLGKTVLKPNVKAALANGDMRGAVEAQYANHYFLGVHPRNTEAGNKANVDDYYNALRRNIDKILSKTGELDIVPLAVAVPGDSSPEPTC